MKTTAELKAELAHYESFRKAEIQKTGFVCGRTFNKISALKKLINK